MGLATSTALSPGAWMMVSAELRHGFSRGDPAAWEREHLHPLLFDTHGFQWQHQHVLAPSMPHVGELGGERHLVRFILHVSGLNDPVGGRVDDVHDVLGGVHEEAKPAVGANRI